MNVVINTLSNPALRFVLKLEPTFASTYREPNNTIMTHLHALLIIKERCILSILNQFYIVKIKKYIFWNMIKVNWKEFFKSKAIIRGPKWPYLCIPWTKSFLMLTIWNFSVALSKISSLWRILIFSSELNPLKKESLFYLEIVQNIARECGSNSFRRRKIE